MTARESLEVDVVIAGAGPAGLACAIRLAGASSPGAGPPRILVLEKGVRAGAHILSGCVLDPRALDELLPDWEALGAPLRQPVTVREVAWLTPRRMFSVPNGLLPPALDGPGHRLVSLSELTAWLAEQARARGVEILEGVAGAALRRDGARVGGLVCGDTGLDAAGRPGPRYVPGAEVRARVTVLAEGARGSLAVQAEALETEPSLDRAPQTYALGLKELWELPAGRFPAGRVLHTLGFPLQGWRERAYGGGFLYGMDETHVAIGLVVGLDYREPRLDPYEEFQRFKTHPELRALLADGTPLEAGARTLPEGGLPAAGPFYGDGWVCLGDSAGLLDPARLKGAHLALLSGLCAGEAVAEALRKGDVSARQLSRYPERLRKSWAWRELAAGEHWRADCARGLRRGLLRDAVRRWTGGRGLDAGLCAREDSAAMVTLALAPPPPPRPEADAKLTFDKPAGTALSGTVHAEGQPCHLHVPDLDLCVRRCTPEFGNPCQHICPAGVYEWQGTLQIHPGNCLHCKACDIKDPYGNILWTVPEGGGGPRYRRM